MSTRTAADTPPTKDGSVTRQSARPAAVALTGRGGIVVIFVLSLFGALAGAVLPLGPVPGILFAGACVTAAFMTRRDDLLILVVAPPLVFLAVTVVARFLAALGDQHVMQSALAGVLLALASGAPWLFLGTLLTVGVTLTRGLPAAVQDLRDRLAAAPPQVGGSRRAPRPRQAPADELDQDPVRWDV